MGKSYAKDGSSTYGGRTIKMRVKATSRHKGYVATRKDLGKPGIGPKLIEIKKPGSLTKHGYSIKKSAQARHEALNKAIKAFGALSVFRKLMAQVTLRKRTQPKARAVFEEDAEWIRSNYKTDGFAS